MGYQIRQVDYFRTTVQDEPGQAFALLSALANEGVNLLAFTAVPQGSHRTELMLFPESGPSLTRAARHAAMSLDGPHRALLVQGDDHLGVLAEIHGRLSEANVNVVAASCVADGRGAYGYVIHIRPEEIDRAIQALEMTGAVARR